MSADAASTTQTSAGIDPAAAVAAYVCGAVGLIIILGITICVVRKMRFRKARKYVKQQSKRTIGMGPVLSNQPPPPSMSKWREVKKAIKENQRARALNSVSQNVANEEASADAPVTLGPPHSKMHGDYSNRAIYSVKQERLKIRIEAKKNKQERKARQKEVKHILTQMLEDKLNGTFVPSGQELPGDQFPTVDRRRMAANGGGASPAVTHISPLRRDSLMAIPNTTLLIERTKGKQPMHKSATSRSLEGATGARGTSSANKSSSSSLSALGYRSMKTGGQGNAQKCEVTVHHVSDMPRGEDVESVRSFDGSRETTEL